MQPDFTKIASSDLVDMLIRDTEYYRELCKLDEYSPNRKEVVKHINLIITELKSREGFKEVLIENDLGITTGK